MLIPESTYGVKQLINNNNNKEEVLTDRWKERGKTNRNIVARIFKCVLSFNEKNYPIFKSRNWRVYLQTGERKKRNKIKQEQKKETLNEKKKRIINTLK